VIDRSDGQFSLSLQKIIGGLMRRSLLIAAAIMVALPGVANAASSITIPLDDAKSVQKAMMKNATVAGNPFEIYVIGGGDIVEPVSNLSPVPEPSTWAMMLAGFAAIGGLARSRNRRLIASFA
jgi:hypothetical protein